MDYNIEKTDITNDQQDISSLRPTPKKTRGTAAKIVALALCCSLVGGAAGAGGVFALDRLGGNNDTKEESTRTDSTIRIGNRDNASIQLTSVDTSNQLTASEIYANNVNSTVGITTSITANYYGYQMEASAAGSGFILTDDGYIVTNYHVVEGANAIQITTYDNESYDAELIGYDESNDIAVLKVDAKNLTPVILGDSDQLNVGDSVVAIGNPLGQLAFSLTSGSVSALNRRISISNVAMNLIQTDCAINSGNSGGALFNSYGEVIGITNAKYSSSGASNTAAIENIGFAIPINNVRNIITSIIENGYIEKTYIGVSVRNAQSYSQNENMWGSGNGFPVDSDPDIKGVVVCEVDEGGPADKAGILEGDVITAVNGTEISNYSELGSILSQGKEGDKYTLTINRDGDTVEIKVKLGVRQQDALPDEQKEENYGQNGWGFPNGRNSKPEN
ncbi:MAG: trypsin-like peptidase domain-containing protein [Clostridiales bacterium]|nr:trypsin-like peptidase domain-containing protein [Clostridiales bacterium]